MNTRYAFLSYLRVGLASLLPALGSSTLSAGRRAKFKLKLAIVDADGAAIGDAPIEKTISLYGPGDINNFNQEAIKSTEPRHETGDFEPNYYPTITLKDPDYPWRYTGFGASSSVGLMPWLTLIVLIAEDKDNAVKEFVNAQPNEAVDQSENKSVRFIKNVSAENLPDLNESWRWAHMQVLMSSRSNGSDTGLSSGQIKSLLQRNPEKVTSRIMCARRLQPGVLYNAFLVPTFKLSLIAAGLTDDDSATLSTLAWIASDRNLTIPYFHRFEFRCGQRGDFEDLVRRLKPTVHNDIGIRNMSCGSPGFGIQELNTEGQPITLQLEGALKSLDLPGSLWGRDREIPPGAWEADELQEEIKQVLNLNSGKLSYQKLKPLSRVDGQSFTSGLLRYVDNDYIEDNDNIEVKFTTSIESYCRIVYGKSSTDQDSMTDPSPDGLISHAFELNNLDVGKQYQLRVESYMPDGTWEIISEISTFRYQPHTLVLPPLYGRWHAKRSRLSTAQQARSWFHEINLDPRHRAAAGSGAEVIRNLQEELMASAWEQAGEIDFSNMIIKVGQLGIEASSNIYQRISSLGKEELLIHNASLHKKLLIEMNGQQITPFGHIKRSRVPNALFDPSYRKLTRKFGPISRRSEPRKIKDDPSILSRFNDPDNPFRPAGDHPLPNGTIDPCELIEKYRAKIQEIIGHRNKADDESKKKSQFVSGKHLNKYQIQLTVNQVFLELQKYQQTKKQTDKNPTETKLNTSSTASLADVSFQVINNIKLPDLDFCDDSFGRFWQAMRDKFIAGGGRIPEITDESTREEIMGIIPFLIPDIFEQATVAPLPVLDINTLSAEMWRKLNPKLTICRRVSQRLNLTLETSLEMIMPGPEFPRAMYKPLEELSQQFICPGIEKVKANEITTLSVNNRFINAYMLSLSHSFGQELKWREYPTDLKGTYFRQFWDPLFTPMIEQQASVILAGSENEDDYDEKFNAEVRKLLEDIRPIDEWKENKLGVNPEGKEGESIVILMKADLLRKYPDTKLFLFRSDLSDEDIIDSEILFERLMNKQAGEEVGEAEIFDPFFKAELKPDISVFGFNLTEKDLKSAKHHLILEDKFNKLRFGKDVSIPSTEPDPVNDWNNLSWEHFGMKDEFHQYVNDKDPTINTYLPSNEDNWNDTSAKIAKVTLQKPVRIAFSVDDMLPPKYKYIAP